MGELRKSCVRGRFYPYSAPDCEAELSEYTSPSRASEISVPPRAGILPHAGWGFSGSTAGRVFATIKKASIPSTFIIFGAVHRHSDDVPAIMMSGKWETPLGNVSIDSDLAERIAKNLDVDLRTGSERHEMEHSIEVQVPFIRYLFPEAKIVPILAPPSDGSAALGAAVGKVVAGDEGVVILGSTDLTHYGPEYGFAPKGTGEDALRWVKEVNDRKILDMMCGMQADTIVGEARQYRNACGSGAAAATVAAAAACGRKSGTLLEYVTSHDVMPRGTPSMFVGYAGIVF